MSNNPSSDDDYNNNRNRRRSSVNISALVILGITILGILIVIYLLVRTLSDVQQRSMELPNAVATQFNQAINPTPTIYADPQTVIRSIQGMEQLVTVTYTIEKVITAESGQGPMGFLFGDQLLLIAQGEVDAGVDLSLIGPEDIQVAGGAVFITLPAPEVFNVTLNEDDTYIYQRDTALLGQNIDLESDARREASRIILQSAIEDGILDIADDNAQATLSRLMYALGFDEVNFVTGTPAPGQNVGGE